MDVRSATLRMVLGLDNQYVIPVFQRYYSWKRDEWEQLWSDVREVTESEGSARSHFMGSLVFVSKEGSALDHRVQVIDGQQRLVTLSLLLCALCDHALEQGFETLATDIERAIFSESAWHPVRSCVSG